MRAVTLGNSPVGRVGNKDPANFGTTSGQREDSTLPSLIYIRVVFRTGIIGSVRITLLGINVIKI